ncbi:A24 family peptidase [Terrilactibacillus sp. S3-3]|nr:A24 family peptidase [Terrilactibacillus sp. S3-3]
MPKLPSKISLLYPLVEAITGALFLSIFIVSPTLSTTLSGWLLVSLLMIVFVADLSYMIIPNQVLLYFSAIFIIFRLLSPLEPWWDSLAGSATGFALLYALLLLSNGGIGGGDVKLFAVMGYLVGTKMLVLGFFFSIMYGALLGVAGMAAGIIKKRQPVPFVPFIVLGMLTAIFLLRPHDKMVSPFMMQDNP